jgi:hypothetical protein
LPGSPSCGRRVRLACKIGRHYCKVTCGAAGCALADHVDKVRGVLGKMETEISSTHIRVAQDNRFVIDVYPGGRVNGIVIRPTAMPTE